jgi:hypothetical protein
MTDTSTTVIRAGRSVPALTPRLLVVAVTSAAAVTLVPEPFTFVAVALALLGAVFPHTLGTWGAAVVIGLSALSHAPDAGDWHLYAMVAVVHLLHVLGAMTLIVEPVGDLQLRTFVRPLRRWLVLQVPAQLVLALALLLQPLARTAAVSATIAGTAAIAAAVAVTVIAVVMMRRRDG